MPSSTVCVSIISSPHLNYCKQILVGYKPDGKRQMKTIYGKTIREVEQKEREIREQIDMGIKVVDIITTGEWSDTWLKTFKSNIAHNTYTRRGLSKIKSNYISGKSS